MSFGRGKGLLFEGVGGGGDVVVLLKILVKGYVKGYV